MWLQIVTFVLQVLTHLSGSRPVSLSKHGRDFDVPILFFYHSKQKVIVSCRNYDTACLSCNHRRTTKPSGKSNKVAFQGWKTGGSWRVARSPSLCGQVAHIHCHSIPSSESHAAAPPGSHTARQAMGTYAEAKRWWIWNQPPESLPVTPHQTLSGEQCSDAMVGEAPWLKGQSEK